MILSFRIFLILICVFLTACTTTQIALPHGAPRNSCATRILQRLYLGTDTPEGVVSEQQWQTFLQKTISPRLPSGLTVIKGEGQWLGHNQELVHETSRIVEIVHSNSVAERVATQEIVSAYKAQFQQEAVLVMRSDVIACL
jgi:hypothetical protein